LAAGLAASGRAAPVGRTNSVSDIETGTGTDTEERAQAGISKA